MPANTPLKGTESSEGALGAPGVSAESIVATIHEPLLVPTPELRVKSVNPAFYAHLRRAPGGDARPPHLQVGQRAVWDIPALRTLLEEVLPDSHVFNDFEVQHDFSGLGTRVMLVNTRRLDHVQLILLGIRDITEQMQAEEALHELNQALERRVEERTREMRGMRERVALLGGELQVESSPGNGTTLSARVPASATEPAATARRLADACARTGLGDGAGGTSF